MIITCPSCTSRYRIDAAKIKGRGAKVTCPKCSHRFVAYKEGGPPVDELENLDLVELGINLAVRAADGAVHEADTLADLKALLSASTISVDDQISWDNQTYRKIESAAAVSAWIRELVAQAKRGELAADSDAAGEEDDEDDEDEDDDDAPTTLIRGEDQIAEAIRKAMAATQPQTDEDPEARTAPIVDADVELDDDVDSVVLEAEVDEDGEDIWEPGEGFGDVETPEPPPEREDHSVAPGGAPPVALIAGGGVVLLLLILAGLWAAGVFDGADAAPQPVVPEAAGD